MLKLTLFIFVAVALIICLSACRTIFEVSEHNFDPKNAPSPPDYTNAYYWAAFPGRKDSADFVPRGCENDPKTGDADIFFVYPTIHGTPFPVMNDRWNANLHDKNLNKLIDYLCIGGQASAFNAAGRVFAPRYRQAHPFAYLAKDTVSAAKAFDLAYQDVKAAFDFYLKNHNHGRPIIIASHSQGTNHCVRLLHEYFDGKPLQKQLVAAYLLGMPIEKGEFKQIKPSQSPTETGVFITWRSYKRGTDPAKMLFKIKYLSFVGEKYHVTNPLNWRTDDTTYMPNTTNLGGLITRNMTANCADAQISNGFLLAAINFRRTWWARVFIPENYHLIDYSLYYRNIRRNAVERVKAFNARS